MPLAGSLDIRDLLTDAPTVTLSAQELHCPDVDILQVLYEVRPTDLEGLVPPALNPTIPAAVSFLVYQVHESPVGPFGLAQTRLTARAGVRPRAFLVSAFCDSEAASTLLARSWGFRIQPGEIELHRYHDRIDSTVTADGQPVLRLSLVDPTPITGHDVQYPPGMHLARVENQDGTKPRLVQVDSEYEFRRADRGQPELAQFDAAAWGNATLEITEPISASFAACDMTITSVRYVCNPDIPASEGTESVETS
jgi:acetoacetate decarboxylase